MQLECIGTGSSGNCYLIEVGSSFIILDCGVPIKKLIDKINLNNVEWCFVSHEHKDHSMSLSTLNLLGVKCLEGKYIKSFVKIKNIGKFKPNYGIYSFPVKHGNCNCAGLIIKTDEEIILYMTDLTLCEYDFSNVKFTSIIIECNYLESKVKDNESEYLRQLENINRHLSLESLKELLHKYDLSCCKEIYLTHFSDKYGDSLISGITIRNEFNISTYCCKKYGGITSYEV